MPPEFFSKVFQNSQRVFQNRFSDWFLCYRIATAGTSLQKLREKWRAGSYPQSITARSKRLIKTQENEFRWFDTVEIEIWYFSVCAAWFEIQVVWENIFLIIIDMPSWDVSMKFLRLFDIISNWWLSNVHIMDQLISKSSGGFQIFNRAYSAHFAVLKDGKINFWKDPISHGFQL